MWQGLADFIDRLPTLFGKLSFPLLVVGVALELALRSGAVPAEAWGGRVADTAPVLWVLGLALAIVWAGLALMQVPSKLRRWDASRAHKDQVRKNVAFLNPHARLLLYYIIRYQGGRTPNLNGIPAFDTLRSFGALELERDFIDAGVDSAGTYRVAPALGKQEQILLRITPAIQKEFGTDLDNPDVLEILLKIEVFGGGIQ